MFSEAWYRALTVQIYIVLGAATALCKDSRQIDKVTDLSSFFK